VRLGRLALLPLFAVLASASPRLGLAQTRFRAEILDSLSSGAGLSLALDSLGRPHVAYDDAAARVVKYAIKDSSGEWSPETVDSVGVGQYCSLALDSGGNPHISYRDFSDNTIKYVIKVGSSWNNPEIVDDPAAGSEETYNSLALDSQGNPHVTYFEANTGSLKHAWKLGGPWRQETVDGSPDTVGENNSLAIDPNGALHVSYRNATLGKLFHALKRDSVSSWIPEAADTLNGVGFSSSLSLDAQSNPRICHFGESGRFDLLYSWKSGGSWCTETVDSAGNVGKNCWLLLDADDNPHVSYYDETKGDLKYASKSCGVWSIEAIDTLDNVGTPTALALNERGPHIAYGDATHLDLKFASLRPVLITVSTPAAASFPAQDRVRAYRAVSFPVVPENPSVPAVLDELWPPDDTKWRFGHWSPITGSYLDACAISDISLGQGYWLITENAQEDSVTGVPVADSLCFSLPLLGGAGAWNQIGSPYRDPVPISVLQVTDGVITFPLTGPSNTLTAHVLWEWIGPPTRYDSLPGPGAPAVMRPFTGYWLHKMVSGSVQLIIKPPPPSLAMHRGADRSQALSSLPAAIMWTVRLRALQDASSTATVLAGAADVPRGEWNPLCLSLPPPPPSGDYLNLFIPKENWGGLSGRYVRVFDAAQDTMTWDLLLESPQVPGEIAIEIDRLQVPGDYRVLLEDHELGLVWEVASERRVMVASTRARRPFSLVATKNAGSGDGALSTPRLRFESAYPNPFADRTGFRFLLGGGATVRVEIYDAQGRAVRRLLKSAAFDGEHVVLWDGRDESGIETASGVYFARYESGELSGTTRVVRMK